MDPLTKLLHVQPFGFFYLLSKRLWVLCRVPFQTVLYILRINKLRPSWTLKKVLILDAVRELLDAPSRTGVTGGRDHTVEVAAKDCPGARFIWVDAIPSEWVVGEIKRLADACGVQPVRIPAYGFGKWDQDLARDGEKVVLNFHGGGYVAATAHPEDITSNIPRGYVQHGISRVLSLDYRLSSTHPYPTVAPFPAALLDALAGYTYLVRTLGFKPQNVIVSGDSAGGNLALALARYLRDTPELGLGMPGGLVLVSPWADPVCTFLRTITDDSPARVNAKTDFIDLPRDESDMEGRHRYALRALIGPISIEEAGQNPYIAPGSIHLEHETGSFRGFPPSYVISGDAEVFVQQIRVLQSRMKEGCEVVYDEVVDAVHDFIVIPQWEPERSNTLRKIVDWIHSLN